MDRRRFLLTSLAGALAAPLAAEGQQAEKVYRIGLLSTTTPELLTPLLAAFQGELSGLGFGQDRVVIDVRYAGGRYEALAELAAELVRLPVDVIVTAQSTPATVAARDATSTIPIVMIAVGEPLKTGLVSNLARPGKNITGSSALSSEITPKRLELIKQLLPRATRVGLLWNPGNASSAQLSDGLHRAARTVDVTVLSVEVRRPADFDNAFTTITRQRPDALIVTADPLHQLHIDRVIAFAARIRLPTIYNVKANVAAGGLMSYGSSPTQLYRRAAVYVAKILNGAKPGDLPVEQPTQFDLAINLKTAKALGLTIPPSLLLRADHVIE